jgi:hypothetical protein
MKYTYYRVIQGNYGHGWNDEDFHECGGDFHTRDYKAFKDNLRAYRENGGGIYRVIKRRELNNANTRNPEQLREVYPAHEHNIEPVALYLVNDKEQARLLGVTVNANFESY